MKSSKYRSQKNTNLIQNKNGTFQFSEETEIKNFEFTSK